MLRPAIWLMTLLLGSFSGVQGRELQHEFPVEVRKILDGDTLQVLHQGQIEVLRLLCIDAPEMGREPQAWAREARSFLRQMRKPKQTLLVITGPAERGSDGQILGMAYYEDPISGLVNLNLALVKKGMAWAAYLDSCPEAKAFESAQKEAQDQKQGLWSLPDPLPPSAYRKQLNP